MAGPYSQRTNSEANGGGGFDKRSQSSLTPFPTMMGEYMLVAKLGGGSMGDLYLAHKMSPYGFVRRAVIKRVKRSRADYQALQRMLLDEARATAWFNHPNLVSILDVGEYEHGVYMALEYVDGTDLRWVNGQLRVRKEALPFELAVFIAVEVLRGLHHAHTAVGESGKPLEIVHRDVNPSNVLVAQSGHIKLGDFGVVRMRDRIQKDTDPGLVKGKYAYLAPEYIAGEPCTIQTDVYATGVMLFELLAGRECFGGGTAYEVMWKIVNRGVPIQRLEKEGVPADLRRIVQRATNTVPERRYPSTQDMANVLEAWLMRSRRHATPWVLSVFFNRHELFPNRPEQLLLPTPLERASSALTGAAGMPRGQLVEEEEMLSQPRVVLSELTPAPALDIEVEVEPEIPILAPEPTDEFAEAVTDAKARLDKLIPQQDTEVDTVEPVHVDTEEDEGLITEPGSRSEVKDPASTPHEPDEEIIATPMTTADAISEDEGVSINFETPIALEEPLPAVSPVLMPAALPSAVEDLKIEAPKKEEKPDRASLIEALKVAIEQEPTEQRTGKLEEVPAVEVLGLITESSNSGTLEFRCGLIWKRVQIDGGTPIGISSNMGMELIGEHLVKARLVSRGNLDRALRNAEQKKQPVAFTLIEMGMLDRPTIEEELGKNLSARLGEVLEWRWGTFDFKPHEVDSAEIHPKLDLAALIERGRQALAQHLAENEDTEDSGEHTPQKKLKKALEVARSIAKSTGKGRVERPFSDD